MSQTPTDKTPALLWVDIETTGLDPYNCSILEIGARCTSMDASTEYARLETCIHINTSQLLGVNLTAMRMHLDNHLLADCETTGITPKAAARLLTDLAHDMLADHVLHPAGTNLTRFDLPFLRLLCERNDIPADWIDRLSYRALDMTAIRLARQATGTDPYKGHAGTHRVHDCLDRDTNEYREFLTLLTKPDADETGTVEE